MPLEPTLRNLIVGGPLGAVIDDDDCRASRARSLGPLLLERARTDKVTLASAEEQEKLGVATLRAQRATMQRTDRLAELRTLALRYDAELFVIKGLWNASRLYKHAWLRPGADIDLMVSHWSVEQRRGFFAELGVSEARVDAFERLAAAGRPLHEMTIRTDSRDTPNLDCHTNPTGLVGPALTVATDAAMGYELPGVGLVLGPSDELSLLIALVNLARKGGLQFLTAADVIRLTQAHGFEWQSFLSLAKAERLLSVCQQVLWALFDDLEWSPASCPITRPSRRSLWTPRLGDQRHRSAQAFTQVFRGRETRPSDVAALVRWYLPNSTLRTARRRH